MNSIYRSYNRCCNRFVVPPLYCFYCSAYRTIFVTHRNRQRNRKIGKKQQVYQEINRQTDDNESIRKKYFLGLFSWNNDESERKTRLSFVFTIIALCCVASIKLHFAIWFIPRNEKQLTNAMKYQWIIYSCTNYIAVLTDTLLSSIFHGVPYLWSATTAAASSSSIVDSNDGLTTIKGNGLVCLWLVLVMSMINHVPQKPNDVYPNKKTKSSCVLAALSCSWTS